MHSIMYVPKYKCICIMNVDIIANQTAASDGESTNPSEIQ